MTYEGDGCCEYDGCLRSFVGTLLDDCECSCHDWDAHYDEE